MSVTAEPAPRPRKRGFQRRVSKALRRALMALALYTIPYLYLAYMWFVYRTSRVETLGPHPVLGRRLYGRVIYALWHQEVFFVAYGFGAARPDTLASQGDAGAVITRMLELCGYNVFRGGSSSGDRRRTVGVIDDLVEHLEKASEAVYGITVDGSKGPVHRMKRGAVQISTTTGVPVVVYKTWCKRYLLKPTWDRTMIPLPFNHIVYVFAGPYLPQAELPEAERYDAIYAEVERGLCAVSAWARRRIEGLPLPQ